MDEDRASRPADAVEPVTVGVIGTGAMGSALVRGWARALGPGIRLLVWDKVPGAMDRVAVLEEVTPAGSLERLVGDSAFVVVVVKPKDGEALLRSLAASLREEQMVVSAMAGVELGQIRAAAGAKSSLFRVMPNLGVEVGAGMVAVSAEPGAPEAEALERVAALFDALGMAVVVPESMLDTVTAVSGTGPALLALALEGLEDGGVAAGLPRAAARLFARGAVLAAARRLVAGDGPAEDLQTCLVPGDSPLQEGLAVLRERRVGPAFQEAVEAAAARARQMRAPSSGGR